MSLEQEKDMYWQSHCARRKQHWGNNLFFYPSFFCWFTTQIFLPSSPSLSLWTLTFLHHQACLPVPPLPLSLSLSLLVFFSFQTNKFLTNWCRYLYHILSIYLIHMSFRIDRIDMDVAFPCYKCDHQYYVLNRSLHLKGEEQESTAVLVWDPDLYYASRLWRLPTGLLYDANKFFNAFRWTIWLVADVLGHINR